MHDPMTVAFEIKYPWRAYSRQDRTADGLTPFDREFRRTYRNSFITVWHKDPEHHGTDDSCGWFTPSFSKTLREICKSLAFDESREPWFMKLSAERNEDPVLCERLLFGAFMLMSRCMVNRGVIRRPVSIGDAQRWAAEATHNSIDNFRSSLCFMSGYHSNWYDEGKPNTIEQDKFWREEQARSFFSSIAGWIMRERRWWFQKPRWHFWHWRFQVHPTQQFKRWLFSRCGGCGKRFAYGESPCTTAWDGDNPRWFKSERYVYHNNCVPNSTPIHPSTVDAGTV